MISLLVVNYRSAALAAEAIRTARGATREALQVVVVDNSCDPAEAEQLKAHADVLLVSETNRGYAGGINAGRKVCEGELIVVSNPDVRFFEDSIDLLAEAVDGGAAVAGPAFFWDEAAEWRLPPADLHSGVQKLDEVLASRSIRWFEMRDRRRFHQRVGFWTLDGETPARALSGAVMAIRAGDFDRVEGFDERFSLYFEETDFLRRLHALRRRVLYVPAARVQHLYNQSAGQVSERAASLYAESEMRYLEKWNGPFAARTLKRFERPLEHPVEFERVSGPIATPAGTVVEASPYPGFVTAAGHFPRGETVDVPPDVWDSLRSHVLFLRTVWKETGEVAGSYARYRT